MRTLQSQIGIYARTQWILLGTTGTIMLGIYLFGIRPAQIHRTELTEQINMLQDQLTANQSRASDLPKVIARVDDLQRMVKRYDKQMPKQVEMGQFLQEVGYIGQSSLLTNWDTGLGTINRTELYGELPVTFKFQGDFMNVVEFLHKLEDMQRLTRVKDITIHSLDQKVGRVEVDLIMNIYYSEK
jgi:Tfp pilus assembly protein PilO